MQIIKNKKNISTIKTLIKTGFFNIVASQIINKIILFASNIFIVRILTKSDYGIYTYANNTISIFLLMNGLGATSGYLQYGSENRESFDKLSSYSRFAMRMGILSSTVISLLIILYAQFFNIKIQDASSILVFMSFIPIINYVYSHIEIEFRVRLLNKSYSNFTMLNSFLMLTTTLLGAYLYNIIGVVLFRYLAYIITIILGVMILFNKKQYKYNKVYLTIIEKKSFLVFSFISCVNNAMSQILYLIDVFVIGLIIPSEEVIASYKTATTIPFTLTFIPITIMIYIYPYFAAHNKDIKWIRDKYYKLLTMLLLGNAIIAVCMLTFAPFIIKIVFGIQYMDSIKPFMILIIGYFISASFRIPSGNILVALHYVKFNLFNSIFSGLCNILLDVILIKKFGSLGAAYANLGVCIISSIISTTYLLTKIKTKKY